MPPLTLFRRSLRVFLWGIGAAFVASLCSCTPSVPDYPLWVGIEEGPVWVFFARGDSADTPGVGPSVLFAPAALARRARNRGTAPVDFRDAQIPAAHLALLESEGFVVRTRSRWLGAVSVDGGEGRRERLLARPEVLRVRPVAGRTYLGPGVGRMADVGGGARGAPSDLSAALGLLELDRVHEAGLHGEGVRVALIDTGFDLSHPALLSAGGRLLASWDFLEDDSVVANETSAEEEAGQDSHGTSVLGVLSGDGGPGGYVGAAPGVSLLLAKSESISVEAPFEEDLWIAAVEWAEQRGADIVSSSLGWSDWIDPGDLDGHTAVSSAFASDFSEATGVLLIQSVGNSGPGPGSLLAPSDSPGILSVGAVDMTGVVADFSGRGPTVDGRTKPDLVAPGVDLPSLEAGTGAVSARSGTSLAAPLVAGLAAIAVEAHPDWTLAELRAALLAAGDQSGAPDSDRGWGLPSAWALCGLACTCFDADGDGAWAAECGGADCDDTDSSIGPGFPEIPYDGLDQDCDGEDLDDLDGDGFPGGPEGADCVDGNPAVFPAPLDEAGAVLSTGGHELCEDSWDNDCDGLLGPDDPDCAETQAGSTPGGSELGCGLAQGAGRPFSPSGLLTLSGFLALVVLRRCFSRGTEQA